MAGPHGERFAYRSFGRAGTRTLVLHMRVRVRVRGAIDHWDPTLLDLLAAEREVVVFDNLGTNFSTGEPPSTMEGLVDGALGLEDVDVLGWSMGDIVAQGVALTAPGLVNRPVVADSSPGGAPDLPRLRRASRRSPTREPGTNDDEDFLCLFTRRRRATYAMSQRPPDAKVVLYSDAGHGSLFQHPEHLAYEVNEFLGR